MAKLTPKEIQSAVKTLKKVAAIPRMPEAVFEQVVAKAVCGIVELIVCNKAGKVLLTWRDDKFYYGWHIPGGFIGVGETIEQAITRIAKREVGGPVKNAKFVGYFNYRKLDPRSHSLSLVHVCERETALSDGKFFSVAEIKKIPKKDLLYHVPYLLKVAKLWR
jgi:8-oxo-dGTP diphosphatase